MKRQQLWAPLLAIAAAILILVPDHTWPSELAGEVQYAQLGQNNFPGRIAWLTRSSGSSRSGTSGSTSRSRAGRTAVRAARLRRWNVREPGWDRRPVDDQPHRRRRTVRPVPPAQRQREPPDPGQPARRDARPSRAVAAPEPELRADDRHGHQRRQLPDLHPVLADTARPDHVHVFDHDRHDHVQLHDASDDDRLDDGITSSTGTSFQTTSASRPALAVSTSDLDVVRHHAGVDGDLPHHLVPRRS